MADFARSDAFRRPGAARPAAQNLAARRPARARPDRGAARPARPAARPAAAGVPRRRDQRQRLDRRACCAPGSRPRGHTVHAFTSPHLVRFNERIRVAGRLIEDEPLEALLSEVIGAGDGIEPSFFEVAAAVAFLAFARTPADAVILEVGLGGRLDATNVIERPAVCGIASIGLDHQQLLGDTPRRSSPPRKPPSPSAAFRWSRSPKRLKRKQRSSPPPTSRGRARSCSKAATGTLDPTLRPDAPRRAPGPQRQPRLADARSAIGDRRLPREAFVRGLQSATWPARFQRLAHGPLGDTRNLCRRRAQLRRRRRARRASAARPVRCTSCSEFSPTRTPTRS